MLVKDFSYHLPHELIARYPESVRDASRLMVLDRQSSSITESRFNQLHDYLKAGDLLILNDTKVLPARLFGTKLSGGKSEIFLLNRVSGDAEQWECLLKSSKKCKSGTEIQLNSGMNARVLSRSARENWLVEFSGDEPFDQWLEREGHIPLPPYLQRCDTPFDRERYQTVIAREPGAVAAPTAGLHFTRELLNQLAENGINTAYITLHTGLGTFQPVRTDNVEDHKIHREKFVIPPDTIEAVHKAKGDGGRVVAVGTTTARTLEYCSMKFGKLVSGSGEADIFIYPGYQFRVVDALITNFHLPESTLLMLVSAFAGYEYLRTAYEKAIASRYRFYSYGDAMLIS